MIFALRNVELVFYLWLEIYYPYCEVSYDFNMLIEVHSVCHFYVVVLLLVAPLLG